jgi:hypothetical protein
MSIYAQWLEAKERERVAIAERRGFEDQMVKEFAIPEDLDGTKTFHFDDLEIKIEGRITKKVDSDKLQDLAAEHGLTNHLQTLFRWKPEIAAAAWNKADPSITTPLLDAITSTSGRPTFKITVKE